METHLYTNPHTRAHTHEHVHPPTLRPTHTHTQAVTPPYVPELRSATDTTYFEDILQQPVSKEEFPVSRGLLRQPPTYTKTHTYTHALTHTHTLQSVESMDMVSLFNLPDQM